MYASTFTHTHTHMHVLYIAAGGNFKPLLFGGLDVESSLHLIHMKLKPSSANTLIISLWYVPSSVPGREFGSEVQGFGE